MSEVKEDLRPFEVEGLLEYQGNLERNIDILKRSLEKEEAKLRGCKAELEVRARETQGV